MDKTINVPLMVNGYSQGGTVVNGIAYFTANRYQEKLESNFEIRNYTNKTDEYPWVGAFDVETLNIVKTYDFDDTYMAAGFIQDADVPGFQNIWRKRTTGGR